MRSFDFNLPGKEDYRLELLVLAFFFLLETGSHYVVKVGLDLMIILIQPLKWCSTLHPTLPLPS
jgi:hypothetical protein